MRLLAAALLLGAVALAADTASNVTFDMDVLPILQKNCQACHGPGKIGPMALLGYQDARPWAKSIKTAVLSRKMPPWFADPRYGHFSNDWRLSDADIAKLAAWVDAGPSRFRRAMRITKATRRRRLISR
jgi:mono/diheme cytochrome c family protein